MLSLIPPGGRGLVVLCLMAALGGGLSACGRRGYPEAPPSAPVQTQPASPRADAKPGTTRQASATGQDDEDERERTPEEQITNVSPQPTPPQRQPRRAFTVPKEPFILDPLL